MIHFCCPRPWGQGAAFGHAEAASGAQYWAMIPRDPSRPLLGPLPIFPSQSCQVLVPLQAVAERRLKDCRLCTYEYACACLCMHMCVSMCTPRLGGTGPGPGEKSKWGPTLETPTPWIFHWHVGTLSPRIGPSSRVRQSPDRGAFF